MKHFWISAFLLIACEKYDAAGPTEPTQPTVAPIGAGTEWSVVRIDPKTFEETPLGKIRIEDKTPWKAIVLEGDAALRSVIAEMNALDHVLAATLSETDPPPRIPRKSDEFFRIMRYGWLEDVHGMRLHMPSKSTATKSFDAIAFDEGKPDVMLGTVAMNDMGYLAITGGPAEHREQLGKVIDDANQRDGESVRIPPPPGKGRGSWGRGVERGTPYFATLQRDRLYSREDTLLVPAGHPRPEKLDVAGDFAHGGYGRWLEVHVPDSLIKAPPSKDALVTLSGPPGGPLGVRITQYKDIANTASALAAHVRKQHGTEPGFTIGTAAEIEIAGRMLLAINYQSGESLARAANLVVQWPHVYNAHDGDHAAEEGITIRFVMGGADTLPTPAQILAHPRLAPAADSLYVDWNGAP